MDNKDEENKLDTNIENASQNMKSLISKTRINLSSYKLDKINENDEDDYSPNNEKENNEENTEQNELVLSLREKISELECKIIDLKVKNEELKKDNIQNDSKLKRMSFVGVRKKFSIIGDSSQNSVQLANLIKEKNDLQEINEKMLNMLTEKELQNEELQESFENYKNELKTEIQKYLDKIEELEQKNEALKETFQNQEDLDKQLEEIMNQYNSYKKRM